MNVELIDLGRAEDLKSVGGKALALGQLLRAGFNVPSGFVLPANSEAAIENVLERFDKLGADYVAVRSSGVSEDSKDAAWAGQFDTFVNVTKKDLIEKIEKCRQSGKSARARSYALQKDIPAGEVAVIVQQMIQGDVSGIAFSVNPITKNSDEVVIEAGYGLNEAIVSGEITPDTYILNKSGGDLQKHVANQTKKLSLTNGANEWVTLDDGDAQKLTDKQIQEVSGVVQKLEEHFKFPVDMEWTIASGKLFILQSRPITTLGVE
ncbi:MAG: ppsA [Candidatus Saccharibacteria bacterium]|nr:ppsA [Candidatus Saccharibacteria bacterium]